MNTLENDLVLKTAKKRVGFKKHITIYILLNLMLWVVFFFLFKGKDDKTFFNAILFILIIWTIIMIGHYFYAIKWNKKMIEKEVESIIQETGDRRQDHD
jgi:fatty acid desaturase